MKAIQLLLLTLHGLLLRWDLLLELLDVGVIASESSVAVGSAPGFALVLLELLGVFLAAVARGVSDSGLVSRSLLHGVGIHRSGSVASPL